MEKRKRGCCGAQHCPCYPNCDQMMSDDWKPVRTERQQMDLEQETDRQSNRVPTGTLQMDQLNRGNADLEWLVRQDEEDRARLKELYPSRIRQIQEEVEHVCDSLEYEGSMMFDEMPEKQRIQELSEGIARKMQEKIAQWEEELQQQEEEDIYVMNHRMAPPPYPPQPPYPPRPVNWFGDLVQVLLQDEMYHRRCRNRNCRRW